MPTQHEKAQRLKALHRAEQPLVLVNVWDAASARIVEDLGFPAIATTSAGVAWVEGFADGEHISRELMLARVKSIAGAVTVPVTADLEGGYGPSVEDAVATARGAIDAGAVGLNFEDGREACGALIEVGLQCKRIAAMRETAAERGVPLVINARTDVFLAQVGSDDAWRLEESIRRGNQYLQAGADCVFVPGTADGATIAALAKRIGGPLNVLAGARTPPVDRLSALGVARVSIGSGSIGFALATFREAAARLRDRGDFGFLEQRISHADLNALLQPERN